MDYVKGKHRGFAFVEYEDAEDAEECIFNMDGADLAGRTIAVSVAHPNQVHKLSSGTGGGGGRSSEAVWKVRMFVVVDSCFILAIDVTLTHHLLLISQER